MFIKSRKMRKLRAREFDCAMQREKRDNFLLTNIPSSIRAFVIHYTHEGNMIKESNDKSPLFTSRQALPRRRGLQTVRQENRLHARPLFKNRDHKSVREAIRYIYIKAKKVLAGSRAREKGIIRSANCINSLVWDDDSWKVVICDISPGRFLSGSRLQGGGRTFERISSERPRG